MKMRFRVWAYGKMFYPDDYEFLLQQDGLVCKHEPYSDLTLEKYEDAVAMLSTGLKDSNGKEIYDGDILDCRSVFGFKSISLVSWNQEIGRWETGIGNNDVTNTQKVILGNIYENPDLWRRAEK